MIDAKHQHAERKWLVIFAKYLFMTIGAFLVAVALELFLVPHNIIDGGVIGIAIILSHLTGLKLSIFILVLNLPFLLIGYKKLPN